MTCCTQTHMDRRRIDIRKVTTNSGQIPGVPANPRKIKGERFGKLCKSIEDLPEMTEARDILVYPHDGKYVVLGGNMRLRAYQKLGWKEVPCCVLPGGMPPEKLRAVVMQGTRRLTRQYVESQISLFQQKSPKRARDKMEYVIVVGMSGNIHRHKLK